MTGENNMETGTIYTHKFSFSQEEVNRFAEVTGDNNPIHLSAEYAEKSIFKKPIMHGFLGASIFSKVFGTLFPGEGTIYLKQSMSFLKPMYVNQEYEAVFTIKEIIAGKNRALIETKIVESETNNITITGEALIQNAKYGQPDEQS
jgi:acyl dehydratase